MKNKNEAATPEGMPASSDDAKPATPEGAQGEAQEQPTGTTDTLFPEQAPVVEEEAKAEDSSSAEAVVEPAPEKTEDPENPTAAEESSDSMVKTIVDGVEKEVPMSEILKGYQTSKHLYNESLKIGDERESLKTLKAEIIEAAKQPKAEAPAEDIDPEGVYVDPMVKALQTQVAQLTELVAGQGKDIAGASQVTAPIAYQNSLTSLDGHLKSQGHTDFMEYVPRIEEAIALLPEESRKQAYTEDFFSHEYAMMKLKDMQNPTKEPVTPAVVNADARPDPKVVHIESANSGGSKVDDSKAAYDNAMIEAKKSGDWEPILKMKKIVGLEH